MIRRFLLGGVALLLFVSLAAPAVAQTSGTPVVTLTHQYIINEFGSGFLNDTFTFHNNGTSTVQVPSFQLGIPDSVASHVVGFAVVPASGYTDSVTDNGTVRTITITPSSPTLAAGASTRVAVDAYLANILNITAGSATPFGAMLLLSPSVNIKLNTLNLLVEVPIGGTLTPAPVGFIASPNTSPATYSITKTNVAATISTQWAKVTDTNQAYFLPIQVTSVVRTIIPGTNGYPQVQDLVTLRNLASYSISSLPLSLLSSSITKVTIVPSAVPPVINPVPVTLTNGALSLSSAPFSAPIQAGDNFSFAMVYSVPSSLIKTSGSTVTVTLPYTLPIQSIAENYTVNVLLPSGMHPVGVTMTSVANATSLSPGPVTVSYSVSTGWAADQAVPVASLLFAAAFIVLALKRPEAEGKEKDEEEEERVTDMLPDLIKGLEDKIALFSQFQISVAGKAQGAVSRAQFSKIRNEIDALKTRSINRLNEIKQTAGSKRFLELLNEIQEAEREEDRAAKDLLNLYDQYHSRRMREETFRRLLPNYRKRWDAATNHLSDLLNMAQKEGKQA
ncbi:MAG: hypothetical protein OK474_11475 [Thaumarchaeota archaeon]|nr:hypothetical protein [Nitrososphaerota archaeon]